MYLLADVDARPTFSGFDDKAKAVEELKECTFDL